LLILIFCAPLNAAALEPAPGLRRLVGPDDGVIIAGPQGKIIFEKNSSEKRIPASTIKILTALVALHHLGPHYRFKTDFFLDTRNNLRVKGYGDPLLISEVWADIAAALAQKAEQVNDIILDDSFFSHPIVVPGIRPSFQPYDAPNGALCANFNTVYFQRTVSGGFISAEPQTPLLPFVIQRIKASSLDSERIILSHENREATLYAGHLLKFFLNQNGLKINGRIRIRKAPVKPDELILRYTSPFDLKTVSARLLEYSNNFIANQILITAGADLYQPPGTLSKGVRAVLSYLASELGISDVALVEGSGISRKNRISAKSMLVVLNHFEPYRHLMRSEGPEYYKTGRLFGVSSRAGYLKHTSGTLYRFVVFMNTPGKSAQAVMQKIRALVSSLPD
jgi:D-alanyl-D-alanine carboxypeptidase/D-alanyl-D-alanine-endopeptidase (penicillin-binding protein 4)